MTQAPAGLYWPADAGALDITLVNTDGFERRDCPNGSPVAMKSATGDGIRTRLLDIGRDNPGQGLSARIQVSVRDPMQPFPPPRVVGSNTILTCRFLVPGDP